MIPSDGELSINGEQPRILLASVQVPFTSGGAELLVDKLRGQLEARGCAVDIVQLPFAAQPKESLLRAVSLWRAVDLTMFNGRKVDMVICTKFPSYMVSHPNKVLWLVHQYRQLYDLYGSRFGDLSTAAEDEALRRMLLRADEKALNECRAVFTISDNVRDRLNRYLGLNATTVVPPLPLGDAYYSGTPGDYILSVGRICSIKRVDLIVKAMSMIDDRLHLKVVGQADEPDIEEYIRSELDKHHLWHRVEFLGRVDDEQLLALYANAFAVYYAPFDEDLGFVTMEALRSGQAVVTAEDSGGPLQYIDHEKNGLVVAPNEHAVAEGFNRLLSEPELHSRLRESAQQFSMSLNWAQVIEEMVSPFLQPAEEETLKQSANS